MDYLVFIEDTRRAICTIRQGLLKCSGTGQNLINNKAKGTATFGKKDQLMTSNFREDMES